MQALCGRRGGCEFKPGARFALRDFGTPSPRDRLAHVVRTNGFVYPMVNRGGAREDWNDESSEAGESRIRLATRALGRCIEKPVPRGWG
jgi:hypothetical protein